MRASGRPLSAIALCSITMAVAGCQESSTFTPVAPSALSERLSRAIQEYPYGASMPILAGRMGDTGGFAIYQGENPSVVYAVDWASAANHVTIAVHRRGGTGVLDGTQPAPDDCFVPFLSSGGTPIGAPLPRPLCPVVLSNTTQEKPKTLEIRNLPPGDYAFVVTNHGPGNETIRLASWDN